MDDFQIIKPFPRKVFFHFLGCTIFPMFVYIGGILGLHLLTFSEFVQVLLHPVTILSIALFEVGIPIVMYKSFTGKIYKYDGSADSVDETNKNIKLFTSILFLHLIFNIIVFIVVPIIVASIKGIYLDIHSITGIAIGAVCLTSTIPYILFVQCLEENTYIVPLRREHIAMSFVLRSVLVCGVTTVGLVAYSLTPVHIPANEVLTNDQMFFGQMLPIAIFGTIVLLIDNILLNWGNKKKIEPLTNLMNSLTQRNYKQREIKVNSRDELGYLQSCVNRFFATTRSLLISMDNAIGTSQASSSELMASMHEVSCAITQINSNITAIKTRVINQSAGVEEADATVSSITEKLDMLNGSVFQQSDSISVSSAAVEEMVANIGSVSEILKKTSAFVNDLANASESGREKVEQAVEQASLVLEESSGLLEASEIIQSIAEQTNLLAMNAAIEAAHAGDAGKGFAVVSDEIRKLAEQSNSQGKTIAIQLEQLQQSISNISMATKEVHEQFTQIASLAETVRQHEAVVENAMQEQTAGSSQVLDGIKNIKTNTHFLEANSKEIHNGGMEISSEMKVLSSMTQEINNSINEIASGINQIMCAANSVSDSGAENNKNMSSLSEEIKKFTL